MNVSLTQELEGFVSNLVKSGDYYSASEVIRVGLRLLKEQETLKQIKIEKLRREIRKGKNDIVPHLVKRINDYVIGCFLPFRDLLRREKKNINR